MRARVASSVAVGLALASVVGCQLIAGTGDLKAHGATQGQGGSANGGGGSSNASVGGAGGSGTAGGGNGGKCEPVEGAPSCDFLTAFGDSGSNFQLQGAAIAADGSSYLAGTATGVSRFGNCGNGADGCPFIQKISASGQAGAKVLMPANNTVSLDDAAVAGGADPVIVIAGTTKSQVSTITVPNVGTVGGAGEPVFVAALSGDLSKGLWTAPVSLLDAVTDQEAQVRVGASADGHIIAAANFATSSNYTWGQCNGTPDLPNPGTEDVNLATFGADGSCIALTVFGGDLTQTADLVRVSGAGRVLLGGTFHDKITFPSGQKESIGETAIYYAYFEDSTKQELWHGIVSSSSTVLLLGGSISNDEHRIAVAGTFSGSLPKELEGTAQTSNCSKNETAAGQGYVLTRTNIETTTPSTELAICLGETNGTLIYDAVVNDDGSVIVAGTSSGHVKYGSFELTAEARQSALFALKIDVNGKLVWATVPKAGPRGVLARAFADGSRFLLAGVNSASIDFGCHCESTKVSANDLFLVDLGP